MPDGVPCSVGEQTAQHRGPLLSSVLQLARSFCLSVSGAVAPSASGANPDLSRESEGKVGEGAWGVNAGFANPTAIA
jgi:hypothetical protein